MKIRLKNQVKNGLILNGREFDLSNIVEIVLEIDGEKLGHFGDCEFDFIEESTAGNGPISKDGFNQAIELLKSMGVKSLELK